MGRVLKALAIPVIVALLALATALPAAAQGAGTTIYLPMVPRNQQLLIADPQWVSPFGIDIYGTLSASTGLIEMKNAGASWVVTYFGWQDVEPVRGAANWASYDAQFLAAKKAGMEIGVLVSGVPNWARGTTYPYTGGGPGMLVAEFADFLARAAERYDGDGVADAPGSPVVKYWTLFAEPDYCGFLQNGVCTPRSEGEAFKGGWGMSGAAYAAMLQEARDAIKRAAPNAVVTNGGLAFDYFFGETYPTPSNPNRQGIYVRNFLADVIAAGGRQYMDMLAVHFYPVTMSNWVDKLAALYNTARDGTQRQQMLSLPLISPEMGFWSSEAGGSSEQMQAIRLVQMFTRGLSQGIQRMAWFAVFDGSPDIPTEIHGLFRGNDLNSPKPAYWAYKTLTFQLHGFRYERAYYTEAGSPTGWDHEAYLFHRRADDARMLVAWANPGSQNPDGVSEVVVDGPQVTVVNMLGGLSQSNPYDFQRLVIQDGSANDADGQANGRVTVRVTQEPVYILLP
jgi:hypothetical protein